MRSCSSKSGLQRFMCRAPRQAAALVSYVSPAQGSGLGNRLQHSSWSDSRRAAAVPRLHPRVYPRVDTLAACMLMLLRHGGRALMACTVKSFLPLLPSVCSHVCAVILLLTSGACNLLNRRYDRMSLHISGCVSALSVGRAATYANGDVWLHIRICFGTLVAGLAQADSETIPARCDTCAWQPRQRRHAHVATAALRCIWRPLVLLVCRLLSVQVRSDAQLRLSVLLLTAVRRMWARKASDCHAGAAALLLIHLSCEPGVVPVRQLCQR